MHRQSARWTVRLFRGVRRGAVRVHAAVLARIFRPAGGQTTVEYALVMLGVAAVAGLLLGWVRGTDLFEKLFDRIVKSVTP